MLPSKANPATLGFAASGSGYPDAFSVIGATGYGSDSDGAYAARSAATAGNAAYLRGTVPAGSDKVYRVTIRCKCDAANSLRVNAVWVGSDDMGVFARMMEGRASEGTERKTVMIDATYLKGNRPV